MLLPCSTPVNKSVHWSGKNRSLECYDLFTLVQQRR